MTDTDRRMSPRVPLRRELTLSGGVFAQSPGLLVDLSLGGAGVLVEAGRSIDPNSDIQIKTNLPAGTANEEFAATCRVASISPFDRYGGTFLGLEFVNLQQEHRRALTHFLRLFY